MVDGPLRVLFANHNGHGSEGGGGNVLHETVGGLRELGVHAEITTELRPDVSGFDLVHAFNVWPPESALLQMRHLRDSRVPVVWEPIFSDLREFTWIHRAVRRLTQLHCGSEEWEAVRGGMETGELVIEGVSCFGPNEVVPGYLEMAREMLAISDHLSVCSLHEIGMLRRLAPSLQTPFTIVPHGIDAEAFAQADAEEFTSRYGIAGFILCVGTIEPRKNQLMLIEATRGLGRPVVLIGPADPEYVGMCRARGGEAVIHIDQIPRELVASAYKAAAVHVLPSFAEGSALATMEAAAAGCDVVASNRSSESEYYGDLARLCDPLSPGTIRAAICHALSDPRGEQLAARMREFPWSRTAETTLHAYRRTLAEYRTHRRLACGIGPVRGPLVLADAYELLSDPQLLRDCGATVDGVPGVTLALYAPTDAPDQVGASVTALISALGLDGPGGPELLLLAPPPGHMNEGMLARACDAILTRASPPDVFAQLPAYLAGAELPEAA